MKDWKLTLAAAIAALSSSATAMADGELHTFHCLFGCPLGAPATNDTVVREIYTLSSNDLTKLADWVAYRVTPDTIGASTGRAWVRDPSLAIEETLTPKDYDGASAALHVDRGHQAPLASFSGTPFAKATNILSNITPQSSALNQGAWVAIESQERALAQRRNTAVYVLTGPLFERMMRPLPAVKELHRVPSGYWKVVALEDGRLTAFVFEQSAGRRDDPCAARVTLDEVRLRSRLLVLPMATGLPTATLDVELGCAGVIPAPAPRSEIPAEERP